MYAPKLQPLTSDERWLLGMNYRIDRMADEAMAEIKAMADKAREALQPPEKPADILGASLRDLMRAQCPYYGTQQAALGFQHQINAAMQQNLGMYGVQPLGLFSVLRDWGSLLR